MTAYRDDERILNEKRRYRDRPYDVQPVTSSDLSDIDPLLRRGFGGIPEYRLNDRPDRLRA